MKSECGRFEYIPEIGIHDSVSSRYISLNGEIIQIKGFQEVQFSEKTKKLVNEFIEQLSPIINNLTEEAKKTRLKSNFYYEFNKGLNEGYNN